MTGAPDWPDHIGWDLARAAELWKGMFRARMVALGYGWYGEARGRLMQYIGPSGLNQSELSRRTGHSKQAIQQMVDTLEAEGVVARVPDKRDARQKRVVLSERGLAFQADGTRIKAEIEEELRARMGNAGFDALRSGLKSLLDAQA
ncbi:MarR family transcriptional regulator [Ruegeria sp. HKCCD8929]|uniref:MarR family winged helix-turn-helix transcriptional regulator n=1 Tax=Ruegeria sp. HKCCD8929 TaxID=2683006 RepID=UPI0014896944